MKLSAFHSVITSKIHCQNLNETLCSSRLGEKSSTSGVIKLGWLWGRSLTKLAAVQKTHGTAGPVVYPCRLFRNKETTNCFSIRHYTLT